ncbi:D-alanine--D-alanine ligase [Bacillus sp. H-16]|uniref:D-alanine--D-alanine ligase n=1 Tax=Alteribacter salitolerans TaxID=2912333 RepID=UPI0019638B5E|nr:D-alanine--D-alanine ligase [Alteribacter salitolerans]MBM7094474.1 D-alanine--D-alanine ligase [Alteribacter salitolerans]
MTKRTLGIIFGGKSSEHEVSLQSAKNVYDAVDKEKYDVVLIGIDKEGKWHLNDTGNYLMNGDDPKRIALNKSNKGIAVVPGESEDQFIEKSSASALEQLDVVFPILHGPLGEDGTMQGMLKLAGLPFVGPDVLGSAVSMDKDVAKRLLKDAGLTVADSITLKKHKKDTVSFEEVEGKLGLPVFIKPANQGSSVGVSRAGTKEEYTKGIETAFRFDNKLIIESAVKGREIECAILGNEEPLASGVGEILPQGDFYSYEAKYIDEKGALLQIPASLSEEMIKKVQEEAVKAFEALECEGMARVDFFLKENDELVINEINTIPGFTKISMYPKLWDLEGISYPKLIDKLIELAIERHVRNTRLESKYF